MKFDNDLFIRALEIATPFVKHWEEFRAAPYLCPTGHWTIGYGSTFYQDGSLVGPHDPPISEITASEMLRLTLGNTCNLLEPFVTRLPTAHELAAMLSLAYNIGVYGYDHSTVLKDFDLGEVDKAADAFLMWDKGRDKHGNLIEIDGLKNRREAERLLFLTPD